MSIEWGLPTVCDILKGAVNLIKRPVKYAMSSKSFANDLREEVGKLGNEARRVHNLAQAAKNNRRIFNDCFTEWQQRADRAFEEARNLLDDFDKASKTCCYGTLPDPICRYQFSTKAEAEIQVIRGLVDNCTRFRALDDICFINTASGNVTAPTPARRDGEDAVQSTTATASVFSASTSIKLRNDGVFESRALMIRNIMDALADNSNSVVGVYGMGGIGKSTLLVDVERKIREGKSFDWVAKADVSENPDIKMIQGEIADALGLTEIREKESIGGRARLLHDRLKDEEREKKKVLIILDNLWKGLELNKVGIPCGHDNRVIGCKLLLTSRDRNVLRSEMSCDKDFPLGELEEDEARSLFERLVGDKVHDDKFKLLMDEALHKCFGMPFLIVHMAKVFKHAALPEWKNVLKQIKLSKNERIGEVINERLQLSYKNLKAAEKSLLALCVACGTSKPSFENLVRYGVGCGLFREDDNMEEARESLKSGICSLQASSLLLEDGDAYGFKIHDLVHEFVASVASRDHPLLVLKDNHKSITGLLKDKLKSCRAVCFPYVDMEELPQELDCPELQIFLLFTDNESLEVPYSLFLSMRKLMVLNLTGIRLTYSPSSSFQFLANLHTLCLDSCSLDNVAILGELKGLQILSIVDSDIYQLPREIGQLVKLRLLDLNHCPQLGIIEPGMLQSLINLEELYMQNSFAQWNIMDQTPPTNASLIELNHLKNLHTLHVSIPNPRMLPEDLNLEKLTKYEIQIGNVWHWLSGCKGSRTLKLELDPLGNVLQKGCIQSIIGKTDDLFLDELDKNKQSVCALSQKGFPELKHLQVKNNSSIHYILQLPSHTHFMMLESLLLENLINLEMICNGHISSKSFSTLKVIRVESCDKMEVLLSLSVVRGLPQLEEIKVVGCKRMRGIVDADDGSKVELHNLRVLELCDLPDIKSFFAVGTAPLSSTLHDQVGTQIALFNEQQVAFPSLDTLSIEGINNIEMIWDNQAAVDSFPNLKFLFVYECNNLVNVVPSFILGRLSSLESVDARGCDSLEVVFELQPLNPLDGHLVALPLRKLTMSRLPKLKRVWDKEIHRQVKFQCLLSVSVSECKSLISLFPASVARDLIQLENLEINNCDIVELIEKEELVVCESYLEEPTSNVEAIKGPIEELKVILPFPRYIQHLKTLNVSHCDGLSSMFTPTVAGNLVALTKFAISNCRMLTEVISDEESKKGHVVAFTHLKCIELDGLIKLRCFNSSGYTLKFPLLEDVIVTGCPNMKIFSEGPIEASKLERVKVSKEAWFWKRNLNITIHNIFEEMGTFVGFKFMQLSDFPELIERWHSELIPNESSWQLESLIVDKCPLFSTVIPSKWMLVLDKMSKLQVHDCESLEEIFDLEGLEAMESIEVLPSFRTLNLVNLPKLRRLWNKELQGSIPYEFLKFITLYKCGNLRHAFVPSMASRLANLKFMEIKECARMEGVIVEEESQGSAVKNITLPNLYEIKLECLPNLISVLLGKDHMLECPQLRWLIIAHCPKIRSLAGQSSMEMDHGAPSLFTPQVQFPLLWWMDLSCMDNLSKIWTDGPQETLTFDCLWGVEVWNCKNLKNLFPYWVATSLTQLEKLRVESCEIEEIVAGGDDTPCSNTTQDLFPKLGSLVLHDMPRLKSFCPSLPTLNWPLLWELRVTHCDKLNMLSFAPFMNSWAQRDDQQDLSDQEAHSSFERDFPNFERLLLVNNNIQMIQDGNFPDGIFSKPKALTLACFHDENAIFPFIFLLERFQKLQSLEVFCSSFEDIFPDEGLIEEGKHYVFENLRKLKLSKLHNLKRVWREDSLVLKILQSIKTFKVWDCPCLTTIFPTATSFQNLRKLVVKNSSGLVYLVTVSAITNLVHLDSMTIIGCERMKEVVANDANREGKVISFGRLVKLTLQHLPSLQCFSSIPSCSFSFSCLMEIKVEECPKMKTFSKSTLSTPKLYNVSLFRYDLIGDWGKGDDLNTTIQKLSA